MREVWRMWSNATLIVLTGLTASLFAAILIPFKGIPLIPGYTELRPANVIPVVFGLLFGPAGAWGAAFGNLIGDFFGTLGPASFFGFWGNFLAAYLTYKVWGDTPPADLARHWPRFGAAVLLGALGCALAIGWGLEILRLLPFGIITPAVLFNNLVTPLVLGALLLKLLAPRVGRWDLGWQDLLDPEDRRPGPLPRVGQALAWVGAGLGVIAGLAASLHLVPLPGWATPLMVTTPGLLVLVLGCLLM